MFHTEVKSFSTILRWERKRRWLVAQVKQKRLSSDHLHKYERQQIFMKNSSQWHSVLWWEHSELKEGCWMQTISILMGLCHLSTSCCSPASGSSTQLLLANGLLKVSGRGTVGMCICQLPCCRCRASPHRRSGWSVWVTVSVCWLAQLLPHLFLYTGICCTPTPLPHTHTHTSGPSFPSSSKREQHTLQNILAKGWLTFSTARCGEWSDGMAIQGSSTCMQNTTVPWQCEARTHVKQIVRPIHNHGLTSHTILQQQSLQHHPLSLSWPIWNLFPGTHGRRWHEATPYGVLFAGLQHCRRAVPWQEGSRPLD